MESRWRNFKKIVRLWVELFDRHKLLVVGWIGQTLIFGEYVRSVANFRTSVGCLEVFIFLATYFYIAAIILLVATELDELVRADMQRPRARQKLLPLVAGVIRGS